MPASAIDQAEPTQTITYFSDGSYLITTITSDTQPNILSREAVNTKSGTKHQDYYDGNHKLVWTFCVHGSFTYDGRNAEATFADYSYDIYNSSWTFNGATASYSDATATATGSFTLLIVPHSITLSLTCSPKGVLS